MQKDRWEKEYSERKDLPSSRTTKPSRALLEFLERFNLPSGSVLDIGSGLGRNAFHLARSGRIVKGIDISETAIEQASQTAKSNDLVNLVEFKQLSAGEPKWPFSDDEFILVLDMMTLHLLNSEERKNYARNVKRVLQPGGYFVFYTIAADSPAAQELFKTSSGPEPNSYIIPQSGMIEKGFTEQELEDMLSPLEVEKLERETQFTPAFGDVFERVYYSVVMKKP